MGRRRRRRGPGSGSHASRKSGTRRRVFITSVSPSGDVSSASPTIRAVVAARDGSILSRHDIDLYLDGEEKRFTYRKATGELKCPTGRLSSGTHTVEIEAYVESDDGGIKRGRKVWTFNVKK